MSVSVRGRFRANNAEAVRWAALEGRGVALLSHLTAQDDIREGGLRLLMPDYPPLRFPLSIVYPSRRNLPPRTRTVIDFLTQALSADPAMALDGRLNARQSQAEAEKRPVDRLNSK